MASYFDEHDCEPLRDGQGPDHFLHFARLLVDSGAWNQSEFAGMFSDRTPPPTSKKFINDLKEHLVREETDGDCCPICLKTFSEAKFDGHFRHAHGKPEKQVSLFLF